MTGVILMGWVSCTKIFDASDNPWELPRGRPRKDEFCVFQVIL